MDMTRLLLTVSAALVLVAVPAGASKPVPVVYALPHGIQPEGVEVGNGNTFYVGSIPTGAVYRGNLRTGVVSQTPVVQGAAGHAALGLEFAHGKLYVAGGP